MSFRLKTILGIAGIELLLLSILVISGLNYIRTSNEEQVFDRAATTARLFASMIGDAVVALDLATLDILVQDAVTNKDVVYIRVRGRNGTVLTQAGQAKALAAEFQADESIEHAKVRSVLDSSAPITVAGQSFGTVEIGIDTQSLVATLADATRWMLSLAAAEIGLVAIFGFILGGILTRQLSDIQIGARRVAEGNFGHLIRATGQDELADTARSFNMMSAALARYATELEAARAQAEAGRDLAETVLEDAVQSLSQGVLIIDEKGNELKRNNAFNRHYPDVMAGLAQARTIDEITQATAPYILRIDDGSGRGKVGTSDYLSGPERWTSKLIDNRSILHTRRPMSTGGWVIVETDVTAIIEAQERARKLERELLQSQKLEALGTLAGGIAHEINTPIQYIGDNLRFLEDATADLMKVIDAHRALADAAREHDLLAGWVDGCRAAYDESDVEFVREEAIQAARQSIEGVRQVSNIVLAMKEFSHPVSKDLAPVDLNRVLERSAVVCKSEWKHVAEFNFDLEHGLPDVVGLEGPLNQVALNLIINAAHAIVAKGDGIGQITVRTRRQGDDVRLEVEDTGTGIPADVIDRIFEPFFTTKDVGRGTGQGLALTHDIIVNKHGGRIDVRTTEGEGTTFIITLPRDAQGQKAA